MAFEEIISAFNTLQLAAVIAIFIAFLWLTKKTVKILINTLGVVFISAVFPFIANAIGIAVPTDLNAIIFFITLGIGLYLFYVVLKIVLAAFGILESLTGMGRKK